MLTVKLYSLCLLFEWLVPFWWPPAGSLSPPHPVVCSYSWNTTSVLWYYRCTQASNIWTLEEMMKLLLKQLDQRVHKVWKIQFIIFWATWGQRNKMIIFMSNIKTQLCWQHRLYREEQVFVMSLRGFWRVIVKLRQVAACGDVYLSLKVV